MKCFFKIIMVIVLFLTCAQVAPAMADGSEEQLLHQLWGIPYDIPIEECKTLLEAKTGQAFVLYAPDTYYALASSEDADLEYLGFPASLWSRVYGDGTANYLDALVLRYKDYVIAHDTADEEALRMASLDALNQFESLSLALQEEYGASTSMSADFSESKEMTEVGHSHRVPMKGDVIDYAEMLFLTVDKQAEFSLLINWNNVMLRYYSHPNGIEGHYVYTDVFFQREPSELPSINDLDEYVRPDYGLSAFAAEPATEYSLSDSANFFSSVFIQSNGNLIVEGVAIDSGDADNPYDVACITTDGKIVWGHHFQYVGEEGIGSLNEMAGGKYVLVRYASYEDGTTTLNYFDGDGFVGTSKPLKGQIEPASEFILVVDGENGKSQRISWLDTEGNEYKHFDHVPKIEASSVYVVEGEDCVFIKDTPEVEQGVLYLTKIGANNGLAWQKEFPLPGYQYIFSDENGGVFAVGLSGDENQDIDVLRIDSEGSLILSDSFDAEGANTVLNIKRRGTTPLLLATDSDLTLIRYDMQGNRINEIRILPDSEHENTSFHIEGMTTAPDGREYVFGREIANDFSAYYGPFLISVDSLQLVMR